MLTASIFRTLLQSAIYALALAFVISLVLGLLILWRANQIKFFRIRHNRLLQGWFWVVIALLCLGAGVGIFHYENQLVEVYFPPTPTLRPTPTFSPSPTSTNTPYLSPTPSPSSTPSMPKVVEIQFTAQNTPLPQAKVSELVFALEMDKEQRPLKAAEIFYNPIQELYVLFRYESFTPGMQVSVLWWKNEELVHYETNVWQGNSDGFAFYRWDKKDAPIWEPGKYTVQLFAGTTWKASGEFIVEDQPPTNTPTQTYTLTATSTLTFTPFPTPSETPSPTYTVSPIPTFTITNTLTNTFTPTATATRKPTRTERPTPTKWPTITLTPSLTVRPTRTPTATNTPRPTQTVQFSPTPRPTYTIPPTITPWNTITSTPTWTPRPTRTPTLTLTNTSTFTPTSSRTPTFTAVPSSTPSHTPSATAKPSTPLGFLLSPTIPTPSTTVVPTLVPTILPAPTNQPTLTPLWKPTSTPRPPLLPWVPYGNEGRIVLPRDLTLTAAAIQGGNRFIQDAPYYYWLATRTPALTATKEKMIDLEQWRQQTLSVSATVTQTATMTLTPTRTSTPTPTITPTQTSLPIKITLTIRRTPPLLPNPWGDMLTPNR